MLTRVLIFLIFLRVLIWLWCCILMAKYFAHVYKNTEPPVFWLYQMLLHSLEVEFLELAYVFENSNLRYAVS